MRLPEIKKFFTADHAGGAKNIQLKTLRSLCDLRGEATKEMKLSIDQCIKCSICSAYCPVLKATGLFPGPKLLGPDAERFRQEGKGILTPGLEFCDYCKICEMVCPYSVPISGLHMRSWQAWRKTQRPSFRDWLLGHSEWLGKLGSMGSPFSNWVTGTTFFRYLLDRGLGIDRRTKIPSYRKRTFLRWFKRREPGKGIPVAYFYGCYTNYIEPELGQAVVEVLEKNGFQVLLPRQECCGLPLIGNGFFDLATRVAKKNVKSLRQTVEKGTEVVFSSPSCGMTLKHEYAGLLNISEASTVKDALFEISQFLVHLHEEGRLQTTFKELKETYYYHVPCHLRALQIGLPALELLSLVPGLKVVELPEGCCGLAGTYGFKREKYEVAREVGQEIFRGVPQGWRSKVISDCEACRMQIAHHTGAETFHPIQILRRAYGA
jgi:glycerol-3-phosphate dehydrogenase subunit C